MATKNKDDRNWLRKILSWAFKRFRGASKDGGGTRETSSGFLSDAVRNSVLVESRLHRGDILEIGCGEGIFLNGVINKSERNKIVGLDIRTKMISRIKNIIGEDFNLVNLVLGSGEKSPFKDMSFDRAVCVNIFYNLHGIGIIENIIKEVSRVLRKDGVFIFEFRNKYNPLMHMLYKKVNAYDPSLGELPLNTYYLHEIKKVLKRNNLKIIKKKGIILPLWYLSPIFIIVAKKETN